MQLSRPWTRAIPSATDSTVPTSERSALSVSIPSIRSRRIDSISSGLVSIWLLFLPASRRLSDALSKFLQATADARVEDHVPYLKHDAAEDLVVDAAGEVALVVGLA